MKVLEDVLELWQWDAQAEFGCHIGQRITCGFTGQSRAPGQTGVHLDDVILQQTNRDNYPNW